MKKVLYLFIAATMFALSACTKDSGKTTSENKSTESNSIGKKQEGNTNSATDKKTPESGQQSTNGAAGNQGGDLPKFTQKVYTKTYKGCDKNKEDCAHISYYNLEMTEGKFKKEINESLRDNALIAYSVEDEHLTDFDKLMDRFMKDYEQFKKDVPDFPGAWYLMDSTSIVNNTPEILCVKNTMENYLGGAHGAYNVIYTNFDMKTGNVLYVKDVFVKGADNKLSKMIEAAVRKQYEVKPNEKLTDAGFFENKIYPNENFAITKDGIEFLFNQYEVAAYALGPVEVKFTYKELEGLLNKNIINN